MGKVESDPHSPTFTRHYNRGKEGPCSLVSCRKMALQTGLTLISAGSKSKRKREARTQEGHTLVIVAVANGRGEFRREALDNNQKTREMRPT